MKELIYLILLAGAPYAIALLILAALMGAW